MVGNSTPEDELININKWGGVKCLDDELWVLIVLDIFGN